jgi:hypothetical protein
VRAFIIIIIFFFFFLTHKHVTPRDINASFIDPAISIAQFLLVVTRKIYFRPPYPTPLSP